jgi:hypothetical protein
VDRAALLPSGIQIGATVALQISSLLFFFTTTLPAVIKMVASRSWWKMPMAVISSGLVTGSSGQIE